jgi:hypothetical protein
LEGFPLSSDLLPLQAGKVARRATTGDRASQRRGFMVQLRVENVEGR